MAKVNLIEALREGTKRLKEGRAGEAERIFRSVLRAFPGNRMALDGLRKARAGNPAGQGARAAAKTERKTPNRQEMEALRALYREGRYQQAADRARVLSRTYANSAALFELAGLSEKALQNSDAAIACYKRAIRLEPGRASLYNKLGNAFFQKGDMDRAIKCYTRALQIAPDTANFLFNIGRALEQRNEIEPAERAYRKALSIDPGNAKAIVALAEILARNGKRDAAIDIYGKALRAQPGNVNFLNNLGVLQRKAGDPDAAIKSYSAALEINPDIANVWNNLGNALRDKEKPAEAIRKFREAIRLEPDHVEAFANMARTIKSQGNYAGALTCARQVLQLDPTRVEAIYAVHFLGPKIARSRQAIDTVRTQFAEAIELLSAKPHRIENPVDEIACFGFDLAYHGKNDRAIMEAFARLYRKAAPVINHAVPAQKLGSGGDGGKIRVGIYSDFLFDHTIGHLYTGLVERLDRDRFEVVVFNSRHTKPSPVATRIRAAADRAILLPNDLKEGRGVIAGQALDVLFYPDIGMSPRSYFLSFARLAPVQAVSWGHPDTTGVDTLDYFISSDLIEAGDADEHYTERLIRLGRLPSFYEMDPAIAQGCAPLSPEEFSATGLAENATLYGCPQSLFKLHPDFDAVLGEIVERDRDAQIVLLEGKHPSWARTLRERWNETHPALNDHVVFLPRLPREEFVRLLGAFDVLLDTPHFGSGNTLYESMLHGKPYVTWPGPFMRGRIVAGAYRQMGIRDAPVAETLQGYAAVAVDWARDVPRQQRLKQQIQSRLQGGLYSDTAFVGELEAFFVEAVAAARQGQRLPIGWRPQHGGVKG